MSDHDTERVRLSQSMDELMIKTIGVMETIPDRISKLETIIRELEIKQSGHEGAQDQGIKRIIDRIENIEKAMDSLKESKDVNDVKKSIKALEDELKPIVKNFKDNVETTKTLKHYVKEAFIAFIRYAMLPITIVTLLLLGMGPEYIPWYKAPVVKEEPKDVAREKPENTTNDNEDRPND